MRLAARIAGILCLAMGLLWIGQGLGLVHWPADSFMIDKRIWSIWGALLAAVGVVFLWFSRRAR